MRFFVTGEWTKNSLLRLIVLFFLVYILAFWATGLVLFFDKMSFSYQSVVDYFRGSPERYVQPRSFRGLMEVTHSHLFAMSILLVTLTHLLLFIPMKQTRKALLIVVVFVAAFANEGSNYLVRFVHPHFAWLKLGSFAVLQISLLLTVGIITAGLLRYSASAYTQAHDKRRSGNDGTV